MAKKHHQEPDPIAAAAIRLATDKGWRSLSLAEIAKGVGLPLAELVHRFPTRADILDAYVRHVDERMLEKGVEAGVSARDRLFEVLMSRFEAMAAERSALAVVLRESGDDPWALACGARRFMRSMALSLEASGVSSSGLAGLVKTEAIALVYLSALRVFLKDDTADLSRTMAALDKGLRRAESAARIMCAQNSILPTAGTETGAGGTHPAAATHKSR